RSTSKFCRSDARAAEQMTDSGAVLVGNAYAQSRSGASMIRHLLCGMLCAALLLLPAAGRANPGDLDPTFGIGGKVTTGIGTVDYAYAVAVQADGKLVAAGETFNGSTADFALARYNANGTLDPTFGTNGTVKTAIGTRDDAASALAIQADGKLVAAGETDNGTNYDFALARYFGSATTSTTTTTLPSPCGDVNGDGSVDIADDLIVAQYDVGLRQYSQSQFTNTDKCDVNQD